MKWELKNIAFETVGEVELADKLFAREVSVSLMKQMILAQRASMRRGTHSTKRAGEVAGSNAKIFKQKGTGRSRAGENRAISRVGGGIAHGPKPRDYSYRLPRSARRAALASALSQRVLEQKIIVLEALKLEKASTKKMNQVLKKAGSLNILVVDAENEALKLSLRNLPRSKYLGVEGINVKDVMSHDTLILTQAALEQLHARYEDN